MNKNIFYLIVVFCGFLLPFVAGYLQNKKYKIINLELFIYSYLFFLIGFILFAKIFYIILNWNINNLSYLFSDDIFDKMKFLLSGYSFIGGYIGANLMIAFFAKMIKIEIDDLMTIYVPNLLFMYAILKLGCYINGCCIGKMGIPVQLIESIVSFLFYLIIFLLSNKIKNKNIIIAFALLSFGIIRFFISFVREYSNLYAFYFVQIFCLLLICLAVNILRENRKELDFIFNV